jgi:hypothetical protein
VDASGLIITCAVYEVLGPGLELRAGYSVEYFQWTQRVADITAARQLANVWREATLDLGFVELSV